MRPRYLDLLAKLASHSVSNIIVGGVAAILEGAPITTLDLDILVETTPENRDRLKACLDEVDARCHASILIQTLEMKRQS